MDTIKLPNKNGTKIIAHRGLSGIECENTIAAFVAAGNRSYFGIETDVHLTADGQFAVFHDDTTKRLSDVNVTLEETTFAALRAIELKDRAGNTRIDLRIPSLAEYIATCKRYGKRAILELKNPMPREGVLAIVDVIKSMEYLDQVTFISFDFNNLVYIKEAVPAQPVQFLCETMTDALEERLQKYGMDLDIWYPAVDEGLIARCHAAGIEVNAWTVDDPQIAERLIGMGIDYITSNILE